MKWITHVVAQRETMKAGNHCVQGCESDTEVNLIQEEVRESFQ